MIVVDASAAVLGLLNDGDARAYLADEPFACPHLADSEIIHALRRQAQRGAVDAVDAERAVATWARLGMRRIPVVGLLERIWELRDNLSAYDATYVAAAEALDTPLLTADARLARAPGVTCAVTVVRT
ncbi:MAG TPA: type II toxin-antitoxin system VapC family toxin [Gaiella sp.]|nr:type II toxin-antitoxin system VapC family toxin [Gaiella sp.]